MSADNSQAISNEISPHIHWGHFGAVLAVMFLLLGATLMQQPSLFSSNKPAASTIKLLSAAPQYSSYFESKESVELSTAQMAFSDNILNAIISASAVLRATPEAVAGAFISNSEETVQPAKPVLNLRGPAVQVSIRGS